MQWYQRDKEDIFRELGSSAGGISADEAQRRLERYGPNVLIEKKRKTAFMMFLDQFRDFMILVLIAAAVISGFIGEPSDTVAIVVIVVLNAVIGFVQEYRAEKAMAALKRMAAPAAVVRRDGSAVTVAASEIVPGDIVVLDAGRVVPADLRLSETAQLRIEEAALTGESAPVEKQGGGLPEDGLPLGDRTNMAYKGTTVVHGRGEGIAVATGMETELGRIAAMLQEEEEVRTPLQKRLALFGRKLAVAVLAICALVFATGVMRGEPLLRMLLTSISLAVAAIPEALPAVVTISLAIGARKMVRQNALIRKLPAVETLGSVTYICTDKTGTLTLNRMTVEQLYVDGKTVADRDLGPGVGRELRTPAEEPLPLFLSALALSNDVHKDNSGAPIGDPTEVALNAIAAELGFEKSALEGEMPRIAEIPFDSERKLMTTFHEWTDTPHLSPLARGRMGGVEPPRPGPSRFISFTKGAVDVLLDRAAAILTSQGPKPLDREEVRRVNDGMASEGLRVLGIAMRTWDSLPEDLTHEDVETGLTMLGLAGIMDPPREEVKEAIDLCRSAGITTVMITGDHPSTARTIAARLGIIRRGEEALLNGRELGSMPLEEFEERVEKIRVYARVAPEQKLKIVKALQDRGHFVAMTGDGVNDAPALKRSDIGVAMGITGTDVSKEASDMVLLDDNFATIVKAVKEGRKIYDNIRKFIRYLLTTNSGEIWTLFLAPMVGLPVPLLPIHILWINLVTDGLPALALSAEPAERDVMKRPPRHPQESIFAHGLGYHAVWVGLLMGGIAILTQAWSLATGHSHWQTMVFTVLCLTQLGHAMAIRSERESLFTIGLLSNRYLLGAVVATFFLQLATVYVPVLNPVFRTEPLTLNELLLTLALSCTVFVAVEIEKLVRRRRASVL